MPADSSIPQRSLVVYRGRPAFVLHAGDKLEIVLEDGETLKVRSKDVLLLHPGPLTALKELHPVEGDAQTAWELLAGGNTTLPELAELVHGECTPSSAWAIYQLLSDGLFFRGTPDHITACSQEEVERERKARRAAADQKQAWADFLARARSGPILPSDAPYLSEAEKLATGAVNRCRLLRELGKEERPENAHALLLGLGFWDKTRNPYPQRLKAPSGDPAFSVPPSTEESRLDLTHLPAFAIDDEGSTDPDDAISLDGNRLWVHVADVASLVLPGSEADIEARSRGANLYLPEGTVHMLPPLVTEGLALGLAEISPALSFGIDLNANLDIERVEVVASRVHVTRVTYEAAEGMLEEMPLKRLRECADVLKSRRLRQGAVEITLPEVKIWVEGGKVLLRPLLPLKSRGLVQEAMLLAGQAVARFALDNRIPFPFSTQEPPDLLHDLPDGVAGMFARRKQLKPSQLRSVPAPHAGTGLDVYAQATSPLRRYLDLVLHQQLRAWLRGGPTLTEQEVLERVGAAEAVTSSLKSAERLSRRHWTLVYLMEQPNWRGKGVLVEIRRQKGLFLLPDLAFEVQVYLKRDLPLNSEVVLSLREVNLPELEAYFEIEG